MLRIFGHYIRMSTVLLGLFECTLISAIAYMVTQIQTGWVTTAPDQVLPVVILSALLLWTVMYALGVYESVTQSNIAQLAQRLAVACVIGAVGLSALYHLYIAPEMQITQSLTVAAISFVAVLSSRALFRWGLTVETLKPRVLVIGAGNKANSLRTLVQPSKDFVVHGFVQTVTGDGRAAAGAAPLAVPREEVVPAIDSLSDYALRNGITEIVVALDDRRGALPVSQLLDCKLHGIRVVDSSTFCEREAGKVDLDNLYPSWLIFSDGFSNSWLTATVKRLFDIVFSLAFVLLTLPVLIVTALAIKLDSPGTVFYRQTRVGQHNKPFEVLKFRSMVNNAERHGAQWATQNDARVTRIGAFIRKTRIDEIPQVLNVLKGDMSFVGPRPERPVFVDQLTREIPYYNDRHRVKPGITGWAQINYPYGSSAEDALEKLKYDLYYMKNHSLFLDMIIILQTVRVVIWSEGAR